MTYHSRRSSAVDAIINAGRADAAASNDMDAKTSSRRDLGVAVSIGHIPPCVATLLSQIMSKIPACTKPCVQFAASSYQCPASSVALATAKAASIRIGRTLHLAAATIDASASNIGPNETSEPLPDTFMAGLYHGRLDPSAWPFAGEARTRLGHLMAPFRFTAVECGDEPASVALAPLCFGTIIVVRAGATSHAAVRKTCHYITQAGGNIIGCVFEDAVVGLPRGTGKA